MTETTLFAEVEVFQDKKNGESVCGDAFFSQRLQQEDRVLGVVSDGLGSGIKANILATMTARMALRFAAKNVPIQRSADIIMDTLPVCSERRISYATFTIVDAPLQGNIRVVEMGNPPFLFIRDGKSLDIKREEFHSEHWPDRVMRLAQFQTRPEDRLVVLSDGITQSGLGNPQWKLGWRVAGCRDFVEARVQADPTISARQLSREVVREARKKDKACLARDDMTCAVFYFRKPRRLMVLTGPPFEPDMDKDIARRMQTFKGRRTVCGGTTASIIARELGVKVTTSLGQCRNSLPPVSEMPGMDLVTEGILTLTRAAQYLETPPRHTTEDSATQLCELLRESDVIQFLVGTRINEAHQDPTLPVDLDIRRNIVKRIAAALRQNYLKEVTIEYI